MRAFFPVLLGSLCLGAGCAQIVGADFDNARGVGASGGAPSAGTGGTSAGSVGFGGYNFGLGGSAGASSGAVPTTCADASYEVGCCASDGNVYFCSKGTLGMTACPAGTCGFNGTSGQYECNTNGAADPTGMHPQACGADGTNAQASCVATQSFTSLANPACNGCVSQLCATEAMAIDTCAADKAACEAQCAKDVACFCQCEVARPNGCASLYRCIDIECRAPCK